MKIPFLKKTEEAPETKSTIDEVLSSFIGWLGFGTSSGVHITEKNSVDVTAVFCAARVIAEGVASMPIELKEWHFDKDGKEQKRKVRNHWAQKLMSRKPNSWQTPGEFVEGMSFVAAIAGEALALKILVDNDTRVYEMIPIVPGAWSVELDHKLKLVYRITLENGEHYVVGQERVLHLRGPSMNGYSALSPIKAAQEAIGLSKALEKQQAKLAGAGGTPKGVLSFDNKLSPEQSQKLKEAWEKQFGPNGKGGVAVLDGQTRFHQMTMSSVDSQTLESRRLQIEEVARAFRVLPLKLMQADKAATFASTEQMQRIHVLDTLMPWVRRWEEALQRDVLSRDENLFFDFDQSLLMRGDHKDQAEYFVKALGSGGTPAWMTQNEVREQAGFPPVDDESANKLPVGAMSENLQNAPSPSQDNGEQA